MATNVPIVGSLTEYTSLVSAIEYIPARYNVIGDLGLFSQELLNTDTLYVPKIEIKDYKVPPVAWGTAGKTYGKNVKGYLPLKIAHRALEDAVTPLDTRGKYAWQDVVAKDRKESVNNLFIQKIATAKQAFANEWSAAMMQLVRDGTAVVDEFGTTVDYYTEFGTARQTVAFDLADETVDPMIKIQELRDNIQNGFKGGYTPSNILVIADPAWFDKLARHPYTIDTYKYFPQSQSVAILNGKLGTAGLNLNAAYQVLDFGGITIVRARTGEMTAGEARAFPLDVPEMFKMFFAPSAENFEVSDAMAQSMYYFEYLSGRNDLYTLKFESNFLPATMQPLMIQRLTTT